MKLLLTSGGVTNTSIRDALVGMLGKPISAGRGRCTDSSRAGTRETP